MKKKIISGILSAVMVFGAFSAMPVSAAVDMENLPVPISSDEKSVKQFTGTVPKLSSSKHANLTWNSVEGALYYEIYLKEPNDDKFKKTYTTFDTQCYTYSGGEYKIRAVAYTYDDVKKYSKYSNIVKYDKPAVKNWEYYGEDDYEADYDYALAPAADAYYDADYGEEVADAVNYSGAYLPAPANAVPEYYGYYETPNTEEYGSYAESGYKNAAVSPLSTFSADVDTASYANLRRLVNNDARIPEDAVRIEEMLNYFGYDYEKPKNSAFKLTTELSDCPWNNKAQLLTVGIQGKDLEKAPDSNLVFLIDVSGSMCSDDKLPLVVKSINMLTKTMGKNDRISIVTYSGEERVILAGAKGTQVKTVADLLSLLDADGCTNGESGINAAYALAEKYYIKGGNNRIILATDGDLNVGISSEDELKKLIGEKRNSGVYFSVLGFGAGNIKDNKMEALADNGNGSYHYIDTAKEAAKVLVEERNSALYTIAKDVKIQVEFNPANVKSYRLIGYDNRRLENEDFTNDAKDAGEVGAGHSVTAVYEIVPADGVSGRTLKYQQTSAAANSGDLLTVKVRYKDPENGKTYQTSGVVNKSDYSKEKSDNMKLVCAVVEFGLVLKGSDFKGTATCEEALEFAQSVQDPDTYVSELISLIKKYTAD